MCRLPQIWTTRPAASWQLDQLGRTTPCAKKRIGANNDYFGPPVRSRSNTICTIVLSRPCCYAIVLLSDHTSRCSPLLFSSHKACLATRHTLSELEPTVPLQLLTNSKQLFNSFCNATRTLEKIIAIDIAGVRKLCAILEGFDKMENNDVGLGRSYANLRLEA